MKQYSYIVADSICDYHIVDGSPADPIYGGIFHGQRITDNERPEYVIAQDDNLSACRFYAENGFEIGGYDNKIYTGTSQEGKGNIIFYKNL